MTTQAIRKDSSATDSGGAMADGAAGGPATGGSATAGGATGGSATGGGVTADGAAAGGATGDGAADSNITADLVYLLSCAVNGKAPDAELIAHMNLEAIFDASERHMLSAAVGVALRQADIHNTDFERAQVRAIRRSVLLESDHEIVTKQLEAQGIWHMPLKGVVMQQLYPIYGMREMSDHDILFDATRADDVRSIMEKLGFTTKSFGKSHHDVYYKKPVSNFEMHRVVFGPEVDKQVRAYYQDIDKRLLGKGCEKHLSPEDFYLVMVAHEHKHYTFKGTGLRSLLDIYVYLREVKLDMDYVVSEAHKMGLAEFEKTNRTLAKRLFSGGKLSEKDQKILDYIMSSGVYGTIGNQVKYTMASKGYSKLRYALSRFFVPISKKNENYEAFAAWYPFFYKHKLLLPVLPFYRTIRALKNGKFAAEAQAIMRQE